MAQLVERLVRNEKASGSNPLISTKKTRRRFTACPIGIFCGKCCSLKSQAWRDATPFLILFSFLLLNVHRSQVNLWLRQSCI